MTGRLHTDGLCKQYGALEVTRNVGLDIADGEFHAIIGPNGAGKTTLVNLLSGELTPSAGRIYYDDADITRTASHVRARRGLLRSYQVTSVFDRFTVRENTVFAALGVREHAFRFWRPMLRRKTAAEAAQAALEVVGLAQVADVPVHELSYGENRQLELAMALAAQPHVLLLDEPMAGMSASESEAITALLKSLKGKYTIVMIEHDMTAVFALADSITVLAGGEILVTDAPDAIRANTQVKAIYLGEEGSLQ